MQGESACCRWCCCRSLSVCEYVCECEYMCVGKCGVVVVQLKRELVLLGVDLFCLFVCLFDRFRNERGRDNSVAKGTKDGGRGEWEDIRKQLEI